MPYVSRYYRCSHNIEICYYIQTKDYVKRDRIRMIQGLFAKIYDRKLDEDNLARNSGN